MKQKLLTILAKLSKERLAIETDMLAHYEGAGGKNLSNEVRQIVIASSKKRIGFDNKVMALLDGGLLTKELYHELGLERTKIDHDLRTNLRAAGLSEADWAMLRKTAPIVPEREQALDAIRCEARAAYDEEYAE